MKASEKHIIVIGAGPGGLTAAMILAHRGFRVSVFEAKDRVGGRNAAIHLGPYTFDTGPTFLMLKPILDEVFREAGADCDRLMDMRRLEPMYRLQFTDRALEPVSDLERMGQEIGRCFPGREDCYPRFMTREKKRFEKLFPCLQKPYHRLRTLLHPDLIAAIPHLALGKSLFSVMKGYFKDDELALAFTFQSKYLGMSPWDCPGLFAIIPYIEHAFGVYHPIGGLSRISDTMADTARSNGAEIHLSTPVKQIMTRDGAVTGVELENGERVDADEVVINADFGYAATKLFAPGVLKKYAPPKMAKKKLSCSTFMLYLGLDTLYDAPHHTICFAENYRDHIEAVARGKELQKEVSFYVRNADVTDPTLSPEGHSSLYILVPVPNNRSGIDWSKHRDEYRELTLDAVERRLPMKGIRSHIQRELMLTPENWEHDLNVFEGATFNLAHCLTQVIHMRPRNKFEEVDNCYLVGGGTHPGSGLPTIYESGRIAANLISREHDVPFVSANLHI